MTTKPKDDHASGGVYEAGKVQRAKRYCFAVLVDNEPGVLARVVGLFSGRGYNIESLTVDEVDKKKNLSRITMVTSGAPTIVDQIKAQLGRLVPVRQVVNLNVQGPFIESGIALIKIIADAEKVHPEAKMIARKYGARVVDETDNAIIFEITSDFDQIEKFIEKVKPLGLAEVARSGSVGIACGEAVLSVRREEEQQPEKGKTAIS